MFFYSIFIRLYAFAAELAAPFSKKAYWWFTGRKDWRNKLQKVFSADRGKVVWFHCASLGEFEQGLPLMRRFKEENPDIFLLVTFFSPSGYEIRRNVPIADHVCYLPVDTKRNARDFLKIAHPEMAVFVKYDFWYHYLDALKTREIPTFFISSIFRPEQYFFKFYGSWTRKYLRNVAGFFVQNETSKRLLESIGVKNVVVSGDTRFDRTLSLAENPQPLPLIEKFKGAAFLVVGGSSWQPEEEILHALSQENHENLKIIIAPHDVSEGHIQYLEEQFEGQCLLYSKANEKNITKYNVLIINSIGLLSRIYLYADMALIGGAFGSGLHNILEALTYGVPVFFGPKTKKFPEAQQAIDAGCGCQIHNADDFLKRIHCFLEEPEALRALQEKSKTFIKERIGATEIIFERLKDYVAP